MVNVDMENKEMNKKEKQFESFWERRKIKRKVNFDATSTTQRRKLWDFLTRKKNSIKRIQKL